jgi:two-component system, NarL family, nitrate/nitrite response regulator NarL
MARKLVLDFTERERRMLHCIAQGMKSKDMAPLFDLSHRTIETYRERLGKKIGARGHSELIAWSIKWAMTA